MWMLGTTVESCLTSIQLLSDILMSRSVYWRHQLHTGILESSGLSCCWGHSDPQSLGGIPDHSDVPLGCSTRIFPSWPGPWPAPSFKTSSTGLSAFLLFPWVVAGPPGSLGRWGAGSRAEFTGFKAINSGHSPHKAAAPLSRYKTRELSAKLFNWILWVLCSVEP